MDLHEIEYYVTLIEEKSFSRAAAKLYLTQPTLSNFLARLEKKMGVELIVRGSHTITPTKFGRLYYEQGKEILEKRDRLYQEIREMKNAETDRIIFGSNSERTIRYISRILPQFQQEYPDTEIILRENVEPELVKDVQNNRLDFCIVATQNDYLDIDRLPITNDEIYLALTKKHPLFEKAAPFGEATPPRFSIDVFQNDSFILLKEKSVMREITNQYLQKARFVPNIIMETQTIRTSLLMLTGGIGTVTFCPKGYDETFGELRYVALEEPPFYSVSVCQRSGETPSASQSRFIRLIRERHEEY